MSSTTDTNEIACDQRFRKPAFPMKLLPVRKLAVLFVAISLATFLAWCIRAGYIITNVKLALNPEYVALSRELGEANTEIHKLNAQTDSNFTRLTPEQQKQYWAAHAKRNAAANRMKEIEFELVPTSRWHTQAGWMAVDYFQDPQVIALCQAIENNDVKEMERLIATGADVNSIGKDGMTPLLWAFPDRKVERFACLLDHGANPNVVIESDFGLGTRAFHPIPSGGSSPLSRGCHAGRSVMHLASLSLMTDYLRLAVAHGGDVNQVDKKTGVAPLDLALDRLIPDARERVAILMGHNVDLNRYCKWLAKYPIVAAVQSNRYDVALDMLEGGADPDLYEPEGARKLMHFVVREKDILQHLPPQKLADYRALVDWLVQHGESLEEAQADEDRWAVMYEKARGPDDFARVRQEIIDERKAQHRGNRAPDKP